MSHITINRDHRLTMERAREIVDALATQLTDRYECHVRWQDDSLHFERSGIAGQIDVEPDMVRVSAQLGFLIAPLKHRLEEEIRRYLDEGFGES